MGELGAQQAELARIMAKRRRKLPMETQIQEEKCKELKQGLIIPAPTNCQYASECMLPVKKDADGNYTDRRFCVYYREVNSATEADMYGLHRPDQIFRDIKGHGYFTKIELRAGFNQIKVATRNQNKTAFWWKNQIYMYTRMPLGLRDATAHFQRMMDIEISKAGLQNNCASFVDDILIYSKNVKEHLEHFKQVLEMLEGCGLKAHPDKTIICANVVEFLGHNVSEFGLLPS